MMPIMGFTGCAGAAVFLISMCIVYFSSAWRGAQNDAPMTSVASSFFTESSDSLIPFPFPLSLVIMPLSPAATLNPVQLCSHVIELLPERRVTLHRITTDLLIGPRGHPGQVRDVCLQAGLAISDRVREESAGNRVNGLGLVRLVGVSATAAQLRLQVPDSCRKLTRIGHQLPHAQIVIELLLHVRKRHAV